MSTRRDAIKAALFGTAGAALAPGIAQAQPQCPPAPAPAMWRRGVENQRVADLGDGRFLNPILAGDYADPTVLKDGDAYYMTHTSHDATPGILLWRSYDLVNWTPLGPILRQPIGSVWAMDLIKHRGRFYLYIPATPGGRQTIMVMHARRMEGPWSDPIDLEIPHIDPGHVVGEDGKRYLFTAGGWRVRLTDDGLAKDGPLQQGYELWHYPDDWVVEMYAPEGPKFLKRDGYFYLIAAVGGTAGPPTSHMVVVSRSRSVFGPWEHCPHNPIVRTTSADERWWSRGHATIVEGPRGDDWWMIYHGYENGFRTLGRHVLLDPIEWTADGWPRAMGGDLSQPIAKPRGGRGAAAGRPLSDDFSRDRFGELWRFFRPGPNEAQRVRYGDGGLSLAAKGTGPADCSPITCIAGDQAYKFSVTLETRAGAEGGALLFYSERAHVGFGFDGQHMSTYVYGQRHDWMRADVASPVVHLKITNDRQNVTMHYSLDGASWIKHPWQLDVSALHQNAFGSFLSLRPALYACGAGDVRFRDFRYRALD